MIPILPPDLEHWVMAHKPKMAFRWNGLLRRCHNVPHAIDIRDFAEKKAFEQVHDVTYLAVFLVRFSEYLGNQPFINATTGDVEGYLNIKEHAFYQYGSLTPHPTRKRVMNKGLRLHAMVALRQFLAFLYEDRLGMTEEAAAAKAKALVKAAKLAVLPVQVSRKLHKLTAKDLASLHIALPSMALSRLGSLQLALWLALLVAHGPRASGCLRSTVGNITKINGLATIEVPPGPLNKQTIPLFLDEASTALLEAYLALHPGGKDKKAPLFVDIKDPNQGQDLQGLRSLLRRLGTRAHLPYQLSVRCFRKWVATQQAIAGGPDANIQRRLGHSHHGRATYRYVQLTRIEIADVVRGVAGKHGTSAFCGVCGRRFTDGDIACGNCGTIRNHTTTDVLGRDPAQLRRDLAGQLGLKCLNDLENPHAA